YLRLIMDEVFGAGCFQREIVWRIGWLSGYKTAAKNWIRNHDLILFYTKGPRFKFNKQYIPYAADYLRRDGSKPHGRGYPLEDTWNCSEVDRLDSIQIMSFNTEKTGYPTQKNENLLARIIEASSDPGDIVFDCFMGSGTAQTAAMKLGRRFIGADINPAAIQTAIQRLAGTAAALRVQPDKYTGFDVYRLGPDDPAPRLGQDCTASARRDGRLLVVEAFYPPELLGRLGLRREQIGDWRELTECIAIDWRYDGAVLRPAVIDLPHKGAPVAGAYDIPADAGRIRVKLTDLMSESLELEV
ncbi:MAG: site-specific DNA-methyltransferase, partial [Clostridia bacterium]|nr:site-specific DNA-methyltransferase [Clostridia bacterium]